MDVDIGMLHAQQYRSLYMDFELPPQDDSRRVETRSWLEANPMPSGRQLA